MKKQSRFYKDPKDPKDGQETEEVQDGAATQQSGAEGTSEGGDAPPEGPPAE